METKVLMEPSRDKSELLAQLVSRFNFAKKMEKQIQQAGLTIGLNTLLIQMLVAMAVGALIGTRLRVLYSPAPVLSLWR